MNAEELYWELNKVYSSLHNDTTIEMAESQAELREALGKGHTHHLIVFKMHQYLEHLRNAGDPYRAKLSAVIKNRFWEKTFSQMIQYKPFKVEDY